MHFCTVIPPIRITHLPGIGQGITASMARLDEIHPYLSGNKIFKLMEYLSQPGARGGIMTFGGPWSNHLVATAYATERAGIPSLGVVRGEEPAGSNPCLDDCRRMGMQLRFVPRVAYGRTLDAPQNYLVIPQGGAGEPGIRGAARIAAHIPGWAHYTHILLPTGTGTTLQGIDRSLLPHQSALGVVVLDIPPERRRAFAAGLGLSARASLDFSFALGGYARKSPALLAFMREFRERHGIPTDFVYTAKAVLALEQLAQSGYFPEGSRVLLLHTGGLQGNRSCAAELPGFSP